MVLLFSDPRFTIIAELSLDSSQIDLNQFNIKLVLPAIKSIAQPNQYNTFDIKDNEIADEIMTIHLSTDIIKHRRESLYRFHNHTISTSQQL